MRITDSQCLSRRSERSKEMNPSFVSLKTIEERALKVKADNDDLLRYLNDYNVLKTNLKENVSEKEDILKMMIA